jgi:hypothetical protein
MAKCKQVMQFIGTVKEFRTYLDTMKLFNKIVEVQRKCGQTDFYK